MRTTLLIPALALIACGSSEPAPARKPARTVAAQPAQPAPPAQPQEQGGMPAGHVMFTVSKMPLDEVLRIFEEQAGLKIAWRGEPRPVSLRLSHPTRWQDALSLVCQFSRTHLARDYQGRYMLKDGWGGELGSDDDVDALLKEQGGGTARAEGSAGGASGGRVTAGRSGGGTAGGTTSASGGATPTRYNEAGAGGLGKSEFGDAYGGGDTARGLLEGTTRTNSGPR